MENYPKTYNIADSPKDSRQTGSLSNKSRIILESIFMSMFNDMDWTKKDNSTECFSNSEKVKNYARGSSLDIGHSSAHETKINGMERNPTTLKENGIPLRKTWWKTASVRRIEES